MTEADALLSRSAVDLAAMDRGSLETERRRFLEYWIGRRPDKITQLGMRLTYAGRAGVSEVIAWASEDIGQVRVDALGLYLMGAWQGFDAAMHARAEDIRAVLALRDRLDPARVSDYGLLLALAAAGAKPDIRPLVEAPLRLACERLPASARRDFAAAIETYFAMN